MPDAPQPPGPEGAVDPAATVGPAGAAIPGDVLDTPEAGRRVMVGGAVRVVGYGAGLIASVLAAAVLLRHLGPIDYGRFSTVIALVTGLQVVTDLGMLSLGLREYAQRSGEDRDRFMRVMLGMRVVTTVLLLAGTSIAAVLLGWDDEMVLGAVLLGVASAISLITGTVQVPLAAEVRMGVITTIDVARQVGTGLAYVALSLAGAGIVWLLGISIPIYVVVFGATYLFVRGTISLRPIFAPAEWRALLAPTFTFALAAAAGSLYVYGAMVLTELVVNEKETGDFAAAFRIYVILAAFPALLVTTAFPVLARAARDDRERLRYAAQRLVESTALLAGAAIIGLVLGALPIMHALATSEFDGAIPVLRIQGIALALTFVIATFGFTLIATHRHRAIIVCNLLALVVSATTVLTLGRASGAQGAAVGLLLGEVTLLASYLVAVRLGDQPTRIDARPLLPIAPALAAGLACWFLPVPAAVSTVIGLVVYAVLALALRALPPEFVGLLPPAIGRRIPVRA